jgi:hypothetical protein
MPAVTLFRDRGVPAHDTPWEAIPTGASAISHPQCGEFTDHFSRGAISVAGQEQPSFCPLAPNHLIRVVGPTDQEPFGHKEFPIQGAHLASGRGDT